MEAFFIFILLNRTENLFLFLFSSTFYFLLSLVSLTQTHNDGPALSLSLCDSKTLNDDDNDCALRHKIRSKKNKTKIAHSAPPPPEIHFPKTPPRALAGSSLAENARPPFAAASSVTDFSPTACACAFSLAACARDAALAATLSAAAAALSTPLAAARSDLAAPSLAVLAARPSERSSSEPRSADTRARKPSVPPEEHASATRRYPERPVASTRASAALVTTATTSPPARRSSGKPRARPSGVKSLAQREAYFLEERRTRQGARRRPPPPSSESPE